MYIVVYFFLIDVNGPDPNPFSALHLNNFQYFFYGASAAFLTIGLISDFIFGGKSPFMLMGIFTVLSILYSGVLITTIKNTKNYEIVILGFLQTLIHVLQLVAIPLMLAAKYRDEVSVWSYPMAG
jgi:hypothetical protein